MEVCQVILKYVTAVCAWLALGVTAHGQQSGAEPHLSPPGEAEPDPTGQRLNRLLRTAGELQQAGQREQAATVRRQADTERQALLRRVEVLQAEVERIRLATGTTPQVVAHVQVIQVSLTKMRAMGLEPAKLTGDPGTRLGTAEKNGESPRFRVVDQSSQACQLLETLRKNNMVKVLAEPTLATLSGRTAVFSAGGELRVPRPQKDGSVAVEDQHYGTLVQLTPNVLGERTIRLELLCRLSELAPELAVQVGKETLPGLRTRDVATAVELQDGQTLVLTGLTEVHEEVSNYGVPIADKVPYLNRMFTNVRVERNEIATLVLVRPEIVRPGAATVRRPAEGSLQR
jgi:Flp pilus assembly secretin CpaC